MKEDLEKCTNEDCVCEECNCGENCECDGTDCECECCEDTCECEECCGDDCCCEDECDCNDEKIKQLENELLKSKAEFINYRKRLEEEHSRFIKYCNEDLVKQLLPTLDNFERAISMDDNNLTDEVSKFLSGFKMIYCNFVNILKSCGVVEIDGNNKPFDANYHEAIMTEKQDGVESGMVLEVLQKGYILNGKVIRPAMVRVSE